MRKITEIEFHQMELFLDKMDVTHHILVHVSKVDYLQIFMPPDRMIGGILFLFCLFVCLFLSVCLS